VQNSFFIDKSCGTILGGAIGDALGAPVEGMKPGHIKSLFKILNRYIDSGDYQYKGFHSFRMKGLYTDDTQQVLTLCDTLLENNGFSLQSLTEKFIELSRENVPGGFGIYRGTGGNFRATMSDLINGIPWDLAEGDTAGCMTAVRIAPVVIFYFNDPIKMLTKAIDASIITHKDPIGISAALLQAKLIHELIQVPPQTTFDIVDILKNCREFCIKGEDILLSQYSHILIEDHKRKIHAVSEFLENFEKIIISGNTQKIDSYIFDFASQYSNVPLHKLTVPFSLTLLPLAIKIFFSNRDSFEKSVIEAINAGGDTDTLGSLVGTLAGAYHGLNSIPIKWQQGLVNFNQIKIRAEALAKGKRGLEIHNLLDMEKRLTSREFDLSEEFNSIKQQKNQKKGSRQIDPTKKTQKDPAEILIPKKDNKVLWRKYEKEKSKSKKSRRSNNPFIDYE